MASPSPELSKPQQDHTKAGGTAPPPPPHRQSSGVAFPEARLFSQLFLFILTPLTCKQN